MLIKTEGDKVNFIDSNDLYVGYDLSQSCCEQASWYIADKPTMYRDSNDEEGLRGFNLEYFVFVPNSEVEITSDEDNSLDLGSLVHFTLQDTQGNLLYLHIFNAHNGYYGHEAITNVSGEVKEIYL